jgi:uncharacterized membrane protein YkoI
MTFPTPRASVRSTVLSVVPALLASVIAPAVFADRIPDAFNDTARNASLWTEEESASSTGCRVAEGGGKLRFEGKGTASGAAYRLRRKIDWNDGFVIDWSQSAVISKPASALRSGRAGLAIGWGAFDPAAGFQDGVNIEVARTTTARRLVLSVRKGGQVVDSASCSSGAVEYDYRLVGSSGFGTCIELYRDGLPAPILSLDGLDLIFANRAVTGMGIAMLASTKAGVTLDSRVDDFRTWGDLHDDADDRLADDTDSADDEDDEDGFDDHPDGGDDDDDDDDGNRSAERSVTVARFVAALDAARSASPLPVLRAEVERVGAAVLVSVVQWQPAAQRLVEVRVNSASGAVVATRSWAPTAGELSRMQDVVAVAATVGVGAKVAVTTTVTGGATISEIELEVEDEGAVWKVEYVKPDGDEDEAEVSAF